MCCLVEELFNLLCYQPKQSKAEKSRQNQQNNSNSHSHNCLLLLLVGENQKHDQGENICQLHASLVDKIYAQIFQLIIFSSIFCLACTIWLILFILKLLLLSSNSSCQIIHFLLAIIFMMSTPFQVLLSSVKQMPAELFESSLETNICFFSFSFLCIQSGLIEPSALKQAEVILTRNFFQ